MTGELLCERCGQNYVVWFAPSDIWNDVMRGGERGNPDEFAFICPTCFTFLAEVAHGMRPTAWEVRPEHLDAVVRAGGEKAEEEHG